MTIAPPTAIAWSEVNAPVPCMSGEAGRCTVTRPESTIFFAIAPASSEPVSIASPNSGYTLPSSTPTRSSLRHITPLGMPVVPPV